MAERTQRLTKRQQRLAEKGNPKKEYTPKVPSLQQQHFELKSVVPITDNQIKTFNAFDDGDHIFLHGCAGTGKTFISFYLALKEIMSGKTKRTKLIIIRNAQSSKDIGFLPGTEKEKLAVYEAAYKAICSELFNRGDAYDILKTKGIIEFHSTSFLRGTTIENAVILVDEVQNQRYSEMRTVLTRTGDNSRIILCGDTKQDDLTSERYKETSGLRDMMQVFDNMDSMSTIHFEIDDIVRSGFVKQFIIAEYNLGLY
jgi:phosphate starvation-inducible protein PhoH